MPWQCAVIGIWAMALALFDLKWRHLPNTIILGGAVGAIAYILMRGYSPLGASPSSALIAGLGALIATLPFYGLGWLGAGDGKFMLAIGLMGGVKVLLLTFVVSSLLTLPYAVWLLACARWRGERAGASANRIPQGLFLAAGLLVAMTDAAGFGLG
ncbi:peptidase A24A, prepilin type IV [Methylocaldum marinum]|uniref:Peptidase A24A, prepilin type IV n=1 Tax=Methylocaldum marinum TaxID=1432792 RepID=A0A250KLS1_9GAMM|nr:A24 family peptidase [Methylocaldum marinum]BBA32517.1 peptidase A24A, prepilin type IV [Methylocaldum marinum]